jgi:hypothetical protein
MQTFRSGTSIAAAATVNTLAGTPAGFVGPGAIISIWDTGDSAAATPLTRTLQVSQGPNTQTPIASGSTVQQASAAGLGPKMDEDAVLLGYAVPPQTTMIMNVTNPAAGAIVYRLLLTLA